MPEWEELSATACSVQNIYLMAHALGIGGVPSAFCPKITGLDLLHGGSAAHHSLSRHGLSDACQMAHGS